MDIKDGMKTFGTHSFIAGIGIAAFAYFLGPQMKRAIRPVAIKGAQSVLMLGSKTMKIICESKDKLTSTMAENDDDAVNRSKDVAQCAGLESVILQELKEEREVSNKILEELRSSISGLKDELNQMKNDGNYQQG